MKESIKLDYVFNVAAEQVFKAWLNSEIHTNMTGGEAVIDNQEGTDFTAWDGYIKGKNIEIKPNNLIIQSWRTSEFPNKAADSILELHFESIGNKTKLTLIHKKIPKGQGQNYKQGWIDHYFIPMEDYFKTLQ